MFRTQYKIVETWTTKKNVATGETTQTPHRYEVRYKNLYTTLFGLHTWMNLFGYDTFNTYTDAAVALGQYITEKKIKEEDHEIDIAKYSYSEQQIVYK